MVAPTLGAFGAAPGPVAALVQWRAVRLGALPAPVGFRAARKEAAGAAPAKKQPQTGLALPGESI